MTSEEAIAVLNELKGEYQGTMEVYAWQRSTGRMSEELSSALITRNNRNIEAIITAIKAIKFKESLSRFCSELNKEEAE